MPTTKFLFLIRHGRTHWNDQHRFMGRVHDVGLNRLGKAQVRNLARFLPVAPRRLFSSPLRRARETAEILHRYTGARITLDPAFTETEFGAWNGLSSEELRDDPHWKRYLKNPVRWPPPGGESLRDEQARVLTAINRRLEKSRHLFIVTHMDVIRVALCHYLNIPLASAFGFHIHNGSLSVVRFDPDPQTLLINWLPPGCLDYFPTR